ncbi:MAG: hypothetical protein LBD11_05800 [Candidatus Peribacteria bacterium]|jgi:hypothetical protein|nr:hypothetical protein [Candidatus Peribacteria bacterium]
MPKSLIPSIQPEPIELSFGQKALQKGMEMYAKLLGKKEFVKNELQAHDGYIVRALCENYLSPLERKKIVGDRKLDEDFNFPLHNVYVHLDEKKILICYRGTDFTDVKDILSDIQIILGTNAVDVRIKQSLEFYDQVTIKYPTHEKRIAGHSLGGTISYIVTKHRTPDRSITFNAGSAPNKAFLSMMQDTFLKKERTKNITTYKIFGDVVSAFSFIGNVQTLFLKSVDPVKLHTIASFPEFFEEKA